MDATQVNTGREFEGVPDLREPTGPVEALRLGKVEWVGGDVHGHRLGSSSPLRRHGRPQPFEFELKRGLLAFRQRGEFAHRAHGGTIWSQRTGASAKRWNVAQIKQSCG
jgi:hypothetical protein